MTQYSKAYDRMHKITENKSIFLLEKPRTTLNNYKKAGLYVPIGITCTWKCEKCCNVKYRKNDKYILENSDSIINSYKENKLVESLILSGLEPFDNFTQLEVLITEFRNASDDDIVIYSGYEEKEITECLEVLKGLNIIVKIGRYYPDKSSKFDNILGITLASENQYGIKI